MLEPISIRSGVSRHTTDLLPVTQPKINLAHTRLGKLMSHLICKTHGRRVFVNPETKSVLHRSEDVKCEFPLKTADRLMTSVSNFLYPSDMCTYCGCTKFDIAEYGYDVCNERWNVSGQNGQPHVFLG